MLLGQTRKNLLNHMTKKNNALVIFTKNLIEGQVKTRLIPQWGTEGALLLYKDLLRKTLETVVLTEIDDIYLFSTPDIDDPFIKFCSTHFEIDLKLQKGSDLGEKMANAFSEMLAKYNDVIIIGCDCPEIKRDDINLASSKLNEGVDIVLGPSEDGGFYLIGMSQARNELFENIPWGSPSVLEETRRKITELKLKSYELKEKWDLDRPEDVYRYFENKN